MSQRSPGAASGSDDRFWLRTLGDVSLRRLHEDGTSEEVLSPGKPMCLLIYLAFSPDRSASRDHLVDLLWSNLQVDDARHALRQALWYLRQQLGRDAIRSRGYELHLALSLDSDRNVLLAAMERHEFGKAVDVYGGEFLPTFAAPGGAAFEHWADTERFRLLTLFLRAADVRVRECLDAGDFQQAKALAKRARDENRLNQSTWRLLLETLLAAGDRVNARIEAHALEELLADGDREPAPPTVRLIELSKEAAQADGASRSDPTLHPELVGREREFASILSAWREARSGRGGHVHVRGHAGLGKTRLLEETRSRLRAMGARVLHVQARPGERKLSYALVSELAGRLARLSDDARVSPGAARVLVDLNPSLTERFPDAVDRRAPPQDELRHRGLALSELLEAIAEEQPLAILIDDLHWTDESSRHVLQSLLGRTPRGRVLAVTTGRPGVEGTLELKGTRRIALEPLDEREIEALLAGLAPIPDAAWARELPGRLERSSGGSPLLILETLRLALEGGWLALENGTWSCRNPEGLVMLLKEGGPLRHRVEGASPEERELLLLLCVAGMPLEAEFLAAASGQTRDAVSRHLESIEVRGLAWRKDDRWAPAHDEIAAGALELAGPERVRAAHLRIGTLWARDEGDVEALRRAGRHLAEAEATDALEKAFEQWTQVVGRGGGWRSPGRMAAEYIGEPVDEASARLARSLPLPVRWGLATPVGRRVAAVVAVTVAATGLALASLQRGAPPAADIHLVVLRPESDGLSSGHQIPLWRDGWDARGAVNLAEESSPVPALQGLNVYSHLVPGPPHRGWAYSAAVPDTGGVDMFLLHPDGTKQRLTSSPGDDWPEAWSPDGRMILFATSRWDRNFWHRLAVYDLETGEIRQLTRGDVDDSSGTWSADGARIAFWRKIFARTPEDADTVGGELLCWITVDGATERCHEPDTPIGGVLGWIGPDEVLAIVEWEGGDRRLATVDAETGAVRPLDARGTNGVLSPDGRWLLIQREAVGGGDAWYVSPSQRPDLAVLLRESADMAPRAFSWRLPRTGSDYLDRLEIAATGPVPSGIPTQLRARGYDRDGSPSALPVLIWSIDEGAPAVVHPADGVLHADAQGTLRVRVSAGGWREATAEVTVEEPTSRTEMDEDWEEGLGPRWIQFGDPPPEVADWPGGGRALWSRGDGYYSSGVYSRAVLSARRGLGIQVHVSTPRTGPRAQQVGVGLRPWTTPDAVAAWDHSTGTLPGGGLPGCSFRYPHGDGFNRARDAHVEGVGVLLPPDIPTGQPWTMQLQLFPDGTCGVALNGVALARSDPGLALEPPYRVVLAGNSLDTEILIGQVEVWEGIRGDVDWRRLPVS